MKGVIGSREGKRVVEVVDVKEKVKRKKGEALVEWNYGGGGERRSKDCCGSATPS